MGKCSTCKAVVSSQIVEHINALCSHTASVVVRIWQNIYYSFFDWIILSLSIVELFTLVSISLRIYANFPPFVFFNLLYTDCLKDCNSQGPIENLPLICSRRWFQFTDRNRFRDQGNSHSSCQRLLLNMLSCLENECHTAYKFGKFHICVWAPPSKSIYFKVENENTRSFAKLH